MGSPTKFEFFHAWSFGYVSIPGSHTHASHWTKGDRNYHTTYRTVLVGQRNSVIGHSPSIVHSIFTFHFLSGYSFPLQIKVTLSLHHTSTYFLSQIQFTTFSLYPSQPFHFISNFFLICHATQKRIKNGMEGVDNFNWDYSQNLYH